MTVTVLLTRQNLEVLFEGENIPALATGLEDVPPEEMKPEPEEEEEEVEEEKPVEVRLIL